MGDPLVQLLDLYSLWALRQLHWETFNRWPGPQVMFHWYERLVECEADDYCGCGSDLHYRACCMGADLARGRVAGCVNFLFGAQGGQRKPPRSIVRSVLEGIEPPPYEDVML